MRIGPVPVGQNAPAATANVPVTKPGKSFATVLDEGSALGPEATAAAAPKPTTTASAPARAATPGPVRAMLERAVGAERQVDALLEAAARGKAFTPAQLLAMQATVARYSQTVEVVSRVADRLVGAIKQTMGTQV